MKNPIAIVFRHAQLLGVLSMTLLLWGCASNPPNNFFEVTVSPGSSVVCMSDPCTVYFATPAGSGTHNILQNGALQAGVAVGGQRTLLGAYSDESVVFHVENTDLPVAYLTVIGGPP